MQILKTALLIFVFLCFFDLIMAQDFYGYYTKLGPEDNITGRHADIIVSYGENGRFVFSRETSYLPRWETKTGKWTVDEIVKRKGDGDDRQPDKYCRHSYVRIIENTPEKVLVHWRYYPDFLKTEMTDVVHEFFTLTPDRRVKREIKKGTEKIEDWKNPGNVTVQTLKLKNDGISQLSFNEAKITPRTSSPTESSPVKLHPFDDVSGYWSFDEGMRRGGEIVKETVSNIETMVRGHKTYWTKGVSGSALKFDGYYSGVQLPMQYAPRIAGEFTIEAWVAMAAHPFGWVPVIHQSNWKEAGYYFGINARGQVGFLFNLNGKWQELITEAEIENFRWTHLAVSFNEKSGKIIIYVDGESKAEMSIEPEEEIMLIHANAPLSIGLNTDLLIPLPRERFRYGQYPCMTGFEGTIDEVRIYDGELTASEINRSYLNLKPKTELSAEFEKRILPGHPGTADKFGAQYKTLAYHDLWDNCWRTSDYDDIIVKFDELPTSVTFWRGPSYGAGWVTDKNLWMLDQSVETGNPISYVEHMSDKQGRYSHVRLIENTDARVVIHWRYSANDVLYSFSKAFGDAGLWVDEYMTIYPDGVGIRKVKQKSQSWIEDPPTSIAWQDVQFAAQPGMTPDEVMHLEAVHLANLKGDTATMDWSDGVPEENPLLGANIELINFKSDYKVFLAFQEGTFINPWGRVPDDMYCHFMTWNHWPVAFITSQGKSSLYPDRVTHSALCAADNAVDHGNMAMYGFTKGSVSELVPLVKSWNNPPQVHNPAGCESSGYHKEQRAYVFIARDNNIKFDIKATPDSPLINPCFVITNIKGRNRNAKASLEINGEKINAGKKFRQGVTYDTEGQPMLIIWLKKSAQEKTRFEITL